MTLAQLRSNSEYSWSILPLPDQVDLSMDGYGTFANIEAAERYISDNLFDYPTGITVAFGGIEIYRRIPYPYSSYSCTHTGVIFNTHHVYSVKVPVYEKDTTTGPVTYCGLYDDHHQRVVVMRARLLLRAFYPFDTPRELVHRFDHNPDNDIIWNLSWYGSKTNI